MNDVEKNKSTLRKRIQEEKKKLSVQSKEIEARSVFNLFEQLPEFKECQNILCYWSLPDELCTHDFVNNWSDKKNIYLPRVEGELIKIIHYSGPDCMRKGSFGIMEPEGEGILNYDLIDLVIVPGVAFSEKGHRMGRGGGYYDRLLPQLTHSLKIGVAYQCQICDWIPSAEHDVKMDMVLFMRS